MANDAFDAMNGAVGNDMYITGGAITVSEYEENMDPWQQKNYENIIDRNFKDAYFLDPYKGNLSYRHWLQTLNTELVSQRAVQYGDIEHGESIDITTGGTSQWMNVKDIYPGMTEYGYAILENAGSLQKLAHLHTGRLEDLISIAESVPDTSDYQGEGALSGSWYRQPLGYNPNIPYAEGETDESVAQKLMPGQQEIMQRGTGNIQ